MIVSKYSVNNSNNNYNAFSQNVINIDNFRYLKTNLSPLSKDTVSFSGGAELTGANIKNSPTGQTCNTLHNNAETQSYYLGKVLEKYLSPINEKAKNGQKPIEFYSRTKSSDSIKEKVCSKFDKIKRKERNKFCEAAVPEIFKHFKPQNGITVDEAVDESKSLLEIISWDSDIGNIPPYKHEKYFLETIVDDFEQRGLIKLELDNPKYRKIVMDDIIDTLETVTNSENCDENGSYINPSTEEGIKHYANDIVGGRIVLNDSTILPKVLDALKKASDDGFLNITSVENYVANDKKIPKGFKLGDYEYIPERKLKQFAKKTYAKYDKNTSQAGYMAIHINLDLSNDLLRAGNSKFNGFSGEIQILDKYVEDLKEIEDLCYKIKDNKSFKDKKYDLFKNHFKKYYKNQKVKEAFDNYTYDLYLFQRHSSALGVKKSSNKFPDLEFFGYDKKIPKELDYNVLREIKYNCERKSDDKKSEHQKPKILNIFHFSDFVIDKLRKFIIDLGLAS